MARTGLSDDLHGWINSGLMTFFFLVAGLEARREFDMGELRERQRLVLPLVIGLGGMIVPIGIYLAFNAGRPSADGWGAAMSTDTAFALGLLALVGSDVPDRVRTYLLTFAIVDDVTGIVIIAVVYSGHIDLTALAVGLVLLGLVGLARGTGVRTASSTWCSAPSAWVAFFESGVDPVVVGLVIGMLALAHPAARSDLERASERFLMFREQPTPELARSARDGRAGRDLAERPAAADLPPLDELPDRAAVRAGQRGHHASAGRFLAHAFTTPVTLGIMLGYVAGKPVGTVGAAWLLTRRQPRSHPAAGRLGGRHRRRHDRRRRPHRVPADRHAGLPRRAACRGQAGRPGRGARAPPCSPGSCSA